VVALDIGIHDRLAARLAGGATPTPELRKLWLTTRLLGLRIRRPDAFAGAYEPLPAGDDVVAYRRGGEVVVAVGTRPDLPAGSLDGVQGRWRDVLSGDERRLPLRVPLAELLDEYGIAVLERS